MGIVVRQSMKGILVNYVGAFIGFLTTFFVLTKFLDPEVIGLTKVFLEVSTVIGSVALMGTSASIMRFFPYFKNSKNNDNGFFFYILLLPTLGILICIPLYLLFKAPITTFFAKNSSLYIDYYYWVIPLILFIVYWAVMESYSTQKMRIVVPRFVREVLIRLLLICVYLLYAFKFLNLDGLIAGFISVYGIAMLVTLFYVSKIGSVTLKHDFSFIDKALRGKIIRYTLFLVLAILSGGILGQLDLFMVSSELGFNYAGIYSIAFYMAAVVEIPSRSISGISSPLAASALKEGDLATANDLYKKVALHQFMAGSCIFLLIWINIDNIFAIMPNGHIYQAGKWVVFFIAISNLLNVTLSFGATLISFSKYYYWGLFFAVFITIAGVTTNLLLIPRLGISGAAIATLVACILSYSVQQWIVMIKIKGNPYTVNLLKQIVLIVGMYAINRFLLPEWNANPFVDGIYRTLIVGGILLVAIYKMRLSEEVCGVVDKCLNCLIKRI
ncbi:MAG: oligosaccharide flippase family protein [Tannerella sp.]|jgi:O-antigen/teichoic acid export membrane protein|nr:oligosaccharide flippase family protein [Tannerella sp.]